MDEKKINRSLLKKFHLRKKDEIMFYTTFFLGEHQKGIKKPRLICRERDLERLFI